MTCRKSSYCVYIVGLTQLSCIYHISDYELLAVFTSCLTCIIFRPGLGLCAIGDDELRLCEMAWFQRTYIHTYYQFVGLQHPRR
jgi:hypothetical protein